MCIQLISTKEVIFVTKAAEKVGIDGIISFFFNLKKIVESREVCRIKNFRLNDLTVTINCFLNHFNESGKWARASYLHTCFLVHFICKVELLCYSKITIFESKISFLMSLQRKRYTSFMKKNLNSKFDGNVALFVQI